MKTCKLENCCHCTYNLINGMYICNLTDEEVFEDTECDLEEDEEDILYALHEEESFYGYDGEY